MFLDSLPFFSSSLPSRLLGAHPCSSLFPLLTDLLLAPSLLLVFAPLLKVWDISKVEFSLAISFQNWVIAPHVAVPDVCRCGCLYSFVYWCSNAFLAPFLPLLHFHMNWFCMVAHNLCSLGTRNSFRSAIGCFIPKVVQQEITLQAHSRPFQGLNAEA